ncbi:MAG: ribosome small subunit-dependent GTPase A [Chloroflexi bacterium]|nr:ribosome small subunit-dependent GTPase A [Chloroflexota bacterium]
MPDSLGHPDLNIAPSASQVEEGLVVRSEGGYYSVRVSSGKVIRSTIRGRLRRARGDDTSLLTLGDRVRLRWTSDVDGVIEERLERSTEFARRSPSSGRHHIQRQVLLANVSFLLIVASVVQPEFKVNRTDRYLVIAEDEELPLALILNKMDLADPDAYAHITAVYTPTGYPILATSTVTGEGILTLRSMLHGHTSAFIGPSGVGKSSLINALIPAADLRIAQINVSLDRGRHTTSVGRLLELDEQSWIADTPGLREIGLYGISRQRLPWLFPEFRPAIEAGCRFSGCTHRSEPGCRVLAAVVKGDIARERHGSYARLWNEAEL